MSTPFHRRAGLVAVLGTLALTTAACSSGAGTSASSTGGSATPIGTKTTGGIVSVALPPSVTPNWIFPLASLANFSVYNISDLQQPMYRPLYWFGGDNDQPTIDYGLSVANKPVYAKDGKTITVSLKDWKWSNGEKVDAKDVLFWMNMVKAEKNNWAASVPGAFPDNITKVTADNAHQVTFTLDGRYGDNWFTYNELSQITPMPMAWDVTSAGAQPGSGGCTTDQSKCAAVYNFLAAQAKDQQSYAGSKIWSVVDGPWKLGTYSSDGHYSFVPNKAYSGDPKPTLDEVKFLPFTSDSAEYNVLRSGNSVDVGYIPSQDLPAKPANADVPATNPLGSGYNLSPVYTWSTNYYVLNFNNPAVGPTLRQAYVRQALAMTLDQPVDVAKADQGYGYQDYSPVPVKPDNQWLSPKAKAGNPYPFDPAQAKSLLESHGWSEQGGVMTCTSPGTTAQDCGTGIARGATLDFAYHYASGSQALDQQVQQYATDAAKAGIKLDVKAEPFNSVLGEAVVCKTSDPSCSWQIANWGGGWIYAPDYLPTGEALFATGAGSNTGSYSDAKMDRLIAATEHQNGTTPLYRYEDYAMAQLPVIFQSNSYTIDAVSNHVGGVVNNPLGTLLPEYWYRTK